MTKRGAQDVFSGELLKKANQQHKKRGLPRALEEDAEIEEKQSPQQFIEDFFPPTEPKEESKDGLPSMEWLKEQYKTKSAVIRYLCSLGFDVKAIAKHTGIRYQMVRNVATTELKRGPNEDWRPKPKAPIIEEEKPDE